MKLTKQERSRLVARISETWGVKYWIGRTHDNVDGSSDPATETITINGSLLDRDRVISTCLHEIGHIVAKRNGKYSAYHDSTPIEQMTRRDMAAFARQALAAERYVDRWALNEARKMFPGTYYWRSYDNQLDVIFLRKFVKRAVRSWEKINGCALREKVR